MWRPPSTWRQAGSSLPARRQLHHALMRPVSVGGIVLPIKSRSLHRPGKPCRYNEGEVGPSDFNVQERQQRIESGLVFAPFVEVKQTFRDVEQRVDQGGRQQSYARMNFADKAEVGINEQINIEYNMSYVYHSMYNYFNRDNVGLPGFAAYFKHQSSEERQHAEKLMEYQSRRGGRVKLAAISPPQSEFGHADKGDALYAAELALSLEKLNFQKLRELHSLAQQCEDADVTHFVEDYLLDEQSRDVKEAATLVSQLQRAGPGHGTVHIDFRLQAKYGDAGDGNLNLGG